MGLTDYSWKFLPSDADKVYGVNDSGWDIFAGTPFKSLAREICQNSLDVRKDRSKPVEVEFCSFDIETSKIPHIEEIKEVLKKAQLFWKTQQNDFSAMDFLNYALEKIESPNIACMRISDKNTTGLTGSNERFSTAWTNLLKGQGVSDKSGTSGGSKGIGKFAPYACSELRTVFYSTIAEDGSNASQGVARLISYLNDDSLYMGLAYYGVPDDHCSPIKEYYSIDPNFGREIDEYGTDIFVIGFKNDEEWKEKMIGSVLDGFLYAILDESLVVKINDIVIDKENVAQITENLDKEFLPEHADEYCKVLLDKDINNFEKHPIKDSKGEILGYVNLRARLDQSFNRTCAMVRQTGMKIKDMNRISSYINFSAVLYIEGDKLNEYLRRLENAQHTEWQIDRLQTDVERKEAKKIIKELRTFVKERIMSLSAQDQNKAINLAIGEYLSIDIPEDENQKCIGEDVNDDISAITITTITRINNFTNEGYSDTKDDVTEDDIEGDYTKAETGEQAEHVKRNKNSDDEKQHGEAGEGYTEAGENTPEDRRKRIAQIPFSKTRMIGRDIRRGEYTVIVIPKESSKNAFLDFFMAAESQNYKANIIKATTSEGVELKVDAGKVIGMNFEAGKEIKIDVQIDYSDICAMEVKGFANKE